MPMPIVIVMKLVDCAVCDRPQVNCSRGSITPSGEAYLTQPHADRVGMCFSRTCRLHRPTVPFDLYTLIARADGIVRCQSVRHKADFATLSSTVDFNLTPSKYPPPHFNVDRIGRVG